MRALAADLETQQQGKIWLLPQCSYSMRQAANELNVSVATVQKWRK